MMDLQTMVSNAVAKQRAEQLAKSPQLTLGELISQLENCYDLATKKLRFDFGDNVPTGIDSWRGSYAELSLHFDKTEAPLVVDFLKVLKETVGKTLEGYKGGDFYMSRHTPVWVANWSESGCSYGEESYASVGVVGVDNGSDFATIKTAKLEY